MLFTHANRRIHVWTYDSNTNCNALNLSPTLFQTSPKKNQHGESRRIIYFLEEKEP